MADISKVKTPDGNTYNVKDSTARDHITNKNNPHGVTKAQIGLGNVDNTSDTNKHVRANNIQWGGANIANDISPLDVATSNLFAGNIMAYSKPDGIMVEYSTDGGTTWADYDTDDNSKTRLVTPETGRARYYLGKKNTAQVATKDLLRIVFDARKMGIYCNPKNLLIDIDQAGGIGCYVNIEYSTRASDTVFHNFGRYDIAGWSGWNSIPIYNIPSGAFGTNGRDDQTVILRLTFGFTGYFKGWETQTNFSVMSMSMIASNRWGTPSNIASVNSIYRLDENQNATFPAKVTATSFSGASATSSADGLMSKSDKAKLDGIGTGSNVKSVNGKTGAVTLAKGDVGLGSVANYDQSKAIKSITRSGTTFTATALDGTKTTFTQQDSDTTYGVATSSADGLMSKSDKSKLDGISAGAEKNTITGVKGSSESSYRTGNVNITKANIGLGNVDNTADNQKVVKSAVSAANDSQGQQINTTYIKELSALGRTITAVKGNGASSIFNIAGDDLYLFYRGVATGDLNKLTTTGIYYVMSGGLANTGPSNIDITYCYLIVIGFAALKQQFILKPDSGMILMRSYLGQHTVVSQNDNLLDENSQPVLDEKGSVVTATFKTPPKIASNNKAVWSRWYKINGIGV